MTTHRTYPFLLIAIIACCILIISTADAHDDPVAHSHETARVDVDINLSTSTTPSPTDVDVDVYLDTTGTESGVTETAHSPLSRDRQDRIINLGRNMTAHMNAAVTRLEHIAKRMESRMKKMESEGVDTTAARDAIARAHTSLIAVKDTLASADTLVVEAVSSDNPQERFINIQSSFTNTRNTIQDAFTHLQTAFLLMKESPSQTSTPDTDVSSTSSDVPTETPAP